jgi:hypothetical protein
MVKSGIIDFLVVGMDDNAKFGPQRKERDILTKAITDKGIGNRVIVKPGADEIAHLLLARSLNEWYGMAPVFKVRYYPEDASAWTPPLEDRPLSESVALALEIAGIKQAVDNKTNADAVLLISGESPAGVSSGSGTATALAADAKNFISLGQPTGVADLRYVNRSDNELVEALAAGIELPKLSAYSGWNTSSNALGTAVSHLSVSTLISGWAKWFLYPNRAFELRSSLEANIDFLFQRFLDEYIFMSLVRPVFDRKITAAGSSPFDIPDSVYTSLRPSLMADLDSAGNKFFNDYFKDKVITVKSGKKSLSYRIDSLRFNALIPWFRPFEAEFDVDVIMSRVQ